MRDGGDDRGGLGSRPRMIMNTPAATTTKRLFTFVIRTRPTFSAKATYGKELRAPPRAVAAPSARRARATVSLSTSLPTMSPTA